MPKITFSNVNKTKFEFIILSETNKLLNKILLFSLLDLDKMIIRVLWIISKFLVS